MTDEKEQEHKEHIGNINKDAAATKPDDKKEKGFFENNMFATVGLGLAAVLAVTGAGFGAVLIALAAFVVSYFADEKGGIKKMIDGFSDKKPDNTPAEGAAPSTAPAASADKYATPESSAVFIDRNGKKLAEKLPNSKQIIFAADSITVLHYNVVGNDGNFIKDSKGTVIDYSGDGKVLPTKDGVVDYQNPETIKILKSFGKVEGVAVEPALPHVKLEVPVATAVATTQIAEPSLTPAGKELKRLQPYKPTVDTGKEAEIWKEAKVKAASKVVITNPKFFIDSNGVPQSSGTEGSMLIRINQDTGQVLTVARVGKDSVILPNENVADKNIKFRVTEQFGKPIIDTSSHENQNVLKEIRKFGNTDVKLNSLPVNDANIAVLGGISPLASNIKSFDKANGLFS